MDSGGGAINRAVAAMGLALAAAIITIALGRLGIVQDFSLKALDWNFKLAADSSRVERRIILIEVDQASLDHFEEDNVAWPWPRSLYNPIIDYASAGGAKAILFDVLFNNLAPYGHDVDLDFAAAIKKSGRVGLAAAFGSGRKGMNADVTRFTFPFQGKAPETMISNGMVSLPMTEIINAAASIGDVHISPDRDGVYRRVPLGVIHEGRLAPALFAIPVFMEGNEAIGFTAGGMAIGKKHIPLDADGKMMVNFTGPRKSYRRYAAAEVIASAMMEAAGEKPQIPKEAFRDSYLILGYTAPGLYDLKPSPLSSESPGMEINAAALDTLLNNRFLVPISQAGLYGLAFAGALIVCAAFFYLPWAVAAGASLAAMGGLIGLSAAAFSRLTVIDPVPPVSSALLAVIFSALWKYQTEGKRKREIRKAFSYYVSPKVVNQMLAEPERLKLGGERRELTILFADLEGFTTISERLDPKDLFSLMNGFTTMMADTITEYDGAVDKYIGDAVMAFWNAPLDQEGHQALAILAALTCRRRLLVMREDILARGLPAVDMRIGINSGVCMVGNMGSGKRFNYSALGDPVNTASRLEGLCKAYGVGSLVAEITWAAAESEVFGREIDVLMVKGKDKPTRVFEIMAARGEQTPEQIQLAEEYTRLLELYRARRWKDAERNAKESLERVKDGPTWTLLARVRHFMESPPPEDWDGSFKHTTK